VTGIYLADRLVPPWPSGAPPLPTPRGRVSAFLTEHLVLPVHPLPAPPEPADDPLEGEDAALALYLCYELHYRGFAGIDEAWEWEPSLLALRRRLEEGLERRLIAEVGPPAATGTGDVEQELKRITAPGDGISLSAWMAEHGSVEQMREFAMHRSAYQLKEADPHTWALPRLTGAAKAALVQIQADEYGDGVEVDMHQSLFAVTLRELGLDPRYGAYVDVLPGMTLATVNLVSFFGLHRRWRGALVGHLAVFEMTSVEPMGRYAAALRRMGYGPVARHFYEVHVVADAHHEAVAARDLAGNLAKQEPELLGDILFGARAVTMAEARLSAHLLACWQAGRSSLRTAQQAGVSSRGSAGRAVSGAVGST
jgi:Iron-containing redox enzyme